MTALAAIGPRKQRRVDTPSSIAVILSVVVAMLIFAAMSVG